MVFDCRSFVWVGTVVSEAFFSAFPNVALAPLGRPALRRFNEGFSTLMLFKDLQPEKVVMPILLTLFGIVMLVKDKQSSKAL